ncbi:MAG: hypothetical protein ACRC8S_06570 [Fimbriiglobus sp.]
MQSRRAFLGVAFCAFTASPLWGQDSKAKAPKPLAVPVNPSPEFLKSLDAKFRDTVSTIMKSPTLTAHYQEEPFFSNPSVYDWLLDHPDRASLAWRRLKVPCLEIQEPKPGQFQFQDDKGTNITWQTVARFADGIVWYGTGNVKPAPVLPVVPVKAVAILKCPRTAVDEKAESAIFEPKVNVFIQTDSKAASAVLRIVGPAAPRMAEQGAEQLLLFFSGPSRYVFEHPEQREKLLAPKAK